MDRSNGTQFNGSVNLNKFNNNRRNNYRGNRYRNNNQKDQNRDYDRNQNRDYDRGQNRDQPRYDQRPNRGNYQNDRNDRNDRSDRSDRSDRNDRGRGNYNHGYQSYQGNQSNQNNYRSNRYNKNSGQSYNQSQQSDEDGLMSYYNQPKIKNQLISYIYNKLEISKYKYKLLEYENEVSLLDKEKFFVSPNLNGINGLMVFIKFREHYHSVIIDRRTLSYNQNQIELDKVKVIPFKLRFDESIYKGSIFDGVLLYNKNSNMKTFVINDVYYFRGANMTDDNMNHKIMNIDTFFKHGRTVDQNIDNIEVIINKLYELKDIKKLVNSYIPKSKYNRSIKGLAFYPEKSGTKLIYLYNNCSMDKDDTSPTHTVSTVIKKVREFNIDTEKTISGTFRMKKSDTVDVYSLYLSSKVTKNGKKYVKYVKYCIAYIPSQECSFFCKDVFENTAEEHVLVKCKYLADKDKWAPFKLATDKKRPDDERKITKKLKKFVKSLDKSDKSDESQSRSGSED